MLHLSDWMFLSRFGSMRKEQWRTSVWDTALQSPAWRSVQTNVTLSASVQTEPFFAGRFLTVPAFSTSPAACSPLSPNSTWLNTKRHAILLVHYGTRTNQTKSTQINVSRELTRDLVCSTLPITKIRKKQTTNLKQKKTDERRDPVIGL